VASERRSQYRRQDSCLTSSCWGAECRNPLHKPTQEGECPTDMLFRRTPPGSPRDTVRLRWTSK